MVIHKLQDIHATISSHADPSHAHEAAGGGQHHPVGDVARPGIHHNPGDGLHDGELGAQAKEQQHNEEQQCPCRYRGFIENKFIFKKSYQTCGKGSLDTASG